MRITVQVQIEGSAMLGVVMLNEPATDQLLIAGALMAHGCT